MLWVLTNQLHTQLHIVTKFQHKSLPVIRPVLTERTIAAATSVSEESSLQNPSTPVS